MKRNKITPVAVKLKIPTWNPKAGDRVWFMHGDKIREREIYRRSIDEYASAETEYSYFMTNELPGENISRRFFSFEIFPTREDLIKSL